MAALLADAGVRRQPRIVASGGRSAALEDYRVAVEERTRAERSFVLVDSECDVAEGDSVWTHLKRHDNWDKPRGADERSAFLMVQCMETWLITDVEALAAYFGAGFNKNPLSRWPHLEQVPKSTVLNALRAATRTGKPYEKGKTSFEALARVRAARVEAACPFARPFFNAMRAL